MQRGSRWDPAERACVGWGLQVCPQPPSLQPCVALPSHTHLPWQTLLPRNHCTPRTRETMTRRVPRTRQKVMGRFPALRAGGGVRGEPVGTVRGGVSLVCLCCLGYCDLRPGPPEPLRKGRAPKGDGPGALPREAHGPEVTEPGVRREGQATVFSAQTPTIRKRKTPERWLGRTWACCPSPQLSAQAGTGGRRGWS